MRSNAFNSILISAFSGIGIVFQFFLQFVIAYYFGTDKEIESYYIAATIPMYISTVLVFCINNSFVPRYLKIKNNNIDYADSFSKYSFLYSFLFSFFIVCLILLFNETILSFFFKTAANQSIINLAKNLSYILFPTILTNVLIALFSSKYQADKNYLIPSLLPVIGSIISIISVLLFFKKYGIFSLVYGVLISNVIQFAILLLPNMWMWRPLKKEISELKYWMKTILILLSGNSITRFAPVMERMACTHQPQGQLAELNYANRIALALSSVISSGIGITGFTTLSEHSGKNDIEKFRDTIIKLLRITLFISIPIALIIFINSNLIIKTLFFRGKFTLENINNVSHILNYYLIFFLSANLGNIFGRGLYALNMTKLATFLDVSGLFFYGLLLFFFSKRYGITGIALAYSLYFMTFSLISGFILLRRINYCPSKKDVKLIIELCIASISLLIFSKLLLKLNYNILFGMSIEFLLFFVILWIFRNEELLYVIKNLLIKIKPKHD